MEVFDGKKAAQDYMSKHTLAFSTPELTLMRFSFWLGDSVPDPKNEGDICQLFQDQLSFRVWFIVVLQEVDSAK